MIKDVLKNVNRYSINENFDILKKELLGFAGELGKLNLPFKAIPVQYETGIFDLSRFENHERNIDVHFIIQGVEQIGVNSAEELERNTDYNDEGDYQLFNGVIRDRIVLREGDFLVLFPGEAHVTAGALDGPKTVKKIVFKIPFLSPP